MEKSTISKSSIADEVKDPIDHELQELVKTLPRDKHLGGLHLYLYNNSFWCQSVLFKSVVSFQKHFQAKDTDIILATALKSGTTWLKALTFNIINRAKYLPNAQHPLLTRNPHELVPNFEFDLYMKDENPNLDDLSCPRILSTHLPFSDLPNSILNSNCRIIYICRNPLDQFISYWHFMLEIFKNQQTDRDNMETPPNIDEAFDLFCQGIHAFGPFWDHALGCWRASIESPHKVLFLKYEDLKYDINTQVKNIAEFLGFGFTMEEEKRGLIEQISNMCSFENLKNLQVNKEGRRSPVVMNSSFFRKGQVGDWANFLSTSQAQHLENITTEKLAGSGLTFKSFCNSSF